LKLEELTKEIIGAAIEVHKALGPGLLESAYEECLRHELGLRELAFERQPSLPVAYKRVKLDCGYRMDIVVERKVVVGVKCVNELLSVHDAQLLTYMRLGGSEVGLLMNAPPPKLRSAGGFHVAALKQDLRRKVL